MSKRPPKKTETIEVRVAPEVKADFMAACSEKDQSASAAIRDFVEAYVARAGRVSETSTWKETLMTWFKTKYLRPTLVGGALAAGAALAIPTAAADPRLEAVFEWLDANHDHALSADEFTSARKTQAPVFDGILITVTTKELPPPNESRTALFQRLDANHDGRVSLAELADVVSVETLMKEPILKADQDGDHKVTAAELAAYITARRARAGDPDPAAGAALMARGLIMAQDRDGDGILDGRDLFSVGR